MKQLPFNIESNVWCFVFLILLVYLLLYAGYSFVIPRTMNTKPLLVHKKDIIPKPEEPRHVHPEFCCQIYSKRQCTVHGVIKEWPVMQEQCHTVSFNL